MSHVSPESVQLPSPECTLPGQEQIIESVVGMHRRLFAAAQQPMMGPSRVLEHAAKIEWSVNRDDMRLSVRQRQSFGATPTVDALRTDGFTVFMYGGAESGTSFLALNVGGELTFTRREKHIRGARMSDEKAEAGLGMLRSFLADEVQASEHTVKHYINCVGEDGLAVGASRIITQVGQESPQTRSELRIGHITGGSFTFHAELHSEDGLSVEYRDIRDYDGPFGFELGQLVCMQAQEEGVMAILPRTPDDPYRAQWRYDRDQHINRTRDVLTTGRLLEVEQRVDAGLEQLAGYHSAYLAANA